MSDIRTSSVGVTSFVQSNDIRTSSVGVTSFVQSNDIRTSSIGVTSFLKNSGFKVPSIGVVSFVKRIINNEYRNDESITIFKKYDCSDHGQVGEAVESSFEFPNLIVSTEKAFIRGTVNVSINNTSYYFSVPVGCILGYGNVNPVVITDGIYDSIQSSGRIIDADIEFYSVTGDPTALGVHFSGTRCDSLPLSYRVSVDLSAVIHN